jgi:GNAT superfamily N-acetyltransferase
MIVRALRENELAALLRLYTLLHPVDPRLDPGSPHISQLWQKMSSDPYIKYYAAEIKGKIVSTCTLTIILNLTRNAQSYGLIENVFTDKSFRKRGIATAVLRYVLAEAWDAGCYKVMLFTGSKKEETLHLYEQAGFQQGKKDKLLSFEETSSVRQRKLAQPIGHDQVKKSIALGYNNLRIMNIYARGFSSPE